jgi:hypothetical protein
LKKEDQFMALPRSIRLALVAAMTLVSASVAAAERYQVFITGTGIEQSGAAYLFMAVKIDNVNGIAWDCLARVSTRKGDGLQANCKQANFQWALPGNADVRSYMAYPFGENLKSAVPMAAMWQLDSAAGLLQICVNNQYNATASGCFLFTDN